MKNSRLKKSHEEQVRSLFLQLCQKNKLVLVSVTNRHLGSVVNLRFSSLSEIRSADREKAVKAHEAIVEDMKFFSLEGHKIHAATADYVAIMNYFLDKVEPAVFKKINLVETAEHSYYDSPILKGWEEVCRLIGRESTPKALQKNKNYLVNFLEYFVAPLSAGNIEVLLNCIEKSAPSEIEQTYGKALKNFFVNHLDYFYEKPSQAAYMLKWARQHMSRSFLLAYENILETPAKNSNNAFEVQPPSVIKNINFDKEAVLMLYPLEVLRPAVSKDYCYILDKGIKFLNNKKNLAQIGAKHIYLRGMDIKSSHWVVGVEEVKAGATEVAANFINKLFQFSSSLDPREANISSYRALYKIRTQCHEKSKSILDAALLERSIPEKNNDSVVERKAIKKICFIWKLCYNQLHSSSG